MSIAENLLMGRELRRPGILGSVFRSLDKRKMLAEAVARMNDLKVGIRSITQAVKTLSGGQRQCVAVGHAAVVNPNVINMSDTVAIMTGANSVEELPASALA